jgi:Txe/YoeB family toxin of Txe-Axe toxin-antitoxin module
MKAVDPQEIKETLIKINDFIQANKGINYRVKSLEREVPNLQELVKKINLTNSSGSSTPEPPKPPLCRVIREGVGHFCTNCGSTMSRSGFLRLFCKRYCDNDKCPNAKPSTEPFAKQSIPSDVSGSTDIPSVFYELQETEENKLTIQITQDNTVHFTLEDWADFTTMEISKNKAIKLAEEIIKHCA